MKAKLFIVYDRVANSYYWAFHTKDFVIETKRSYKKYKLCKKMAWVFVKNHHLFHLLGNCKEINKSI